MYLVALVSSVITASGSSRTSSRRLAGRVDRGRHRVITSPSRVRGHPSSRLLARDVVLLSTVLSVPVLVGIALLLG
jgi:hypothetical protein